MSKEETSFSDKDIYTISVSDCIDAFIVIIDFIKTEHKFILHINTGLTWRTFI